jgi:hypothetical protein
MGFKGNITVMHEHKMIEMILNAIENLPFDKRYNRIHNTRKELFMSAMAVIVLILVRLRVVVW